MQDGQDGPCAEISGIRSNRQQQAATGSMQNCDALSGRDQTGWRRNRASLAASSPAAASGESLSLKMLFPALAII